MEECSYGRLRRGVECIEKEGEGTGQPWKAWKRDFRECLGKKGKRRVQPWRAWKRRTGRRASEMIERNNATLVQPLKAWKINFRERKCFFNHSMGWGEV